METDGTTLQIGIKATRSTRRTVHPCRYGEPGSAENRNSKNIGYISMNEIPDFNSMSPYDRYDAAITAIAERAPLEFPIGEKLVGQVTLQEAVKGLFLPVKYHGKEIFKSVNPLTCNFDKLLQVGLNQYMVTLSDHAAGMYAENNTERKEYRFLESLACVYKSIAILHRRYMRELRRLQKDADSEENATYYGELLYYLKDVPFKRPASFRSALQSLWFVLTFLRLCGNRPAIGRLDIMLEPFLQADLKAGMLTISEAEELIRHFLQKNSAWISAEKSVNINIQRDCGIVLGGVDAEGKQAEGDVTRLIFTAAEKLPTLHFPLSVRTSTRTPQWVKEKAAEICGRGNGPIAVYNEDLVIARMVQSGYALSEARQFANSGEGKIQVPGKTRSSEVTCDALLLFQREVLHLDRPNFAKLVKGYASAESILQTYLSALKNFIGDFYELACKAYVPHWGPASVAAFFSDSCEEQAKDYFAGGTRYTSFSLFCKGFSDTANIICAIQRLVYEEGKVTLPELVQGLKDSTRGTELLQSLYAQYSRTEEDVAQAEQILMQIVSFYTEEMQQIRTKGNVQCFAGISGLQAKGTELQEILADVHAHPVYASSELTVGTELEVQLDSEIGKTQAAANTAINKLFDNFLAYDGFFMRITVGNETQTQK